MGWNLMMASETLHWVHARKSLYCCEGIPNGDSGESSEREEASWKESFYLLREYISNYVQNVGRNVDNKDHSCLTQK